jgi:hypothetical protein
LAFCGQGQPLTGLVNLLTDGGSFIPWSTFFATSNLLKIIDVSSKSLQREASAGLE